MFITEQLLFALRGGGGGLSNTHTHYLNQFYFRISYIDKSYKKHPNTELQQTAFIWISYRQRNFHPQGTPSSEVSFATKKGEKKFLQSAPRAGHSHQKKKRPIFNSHYTTLTGSLTEKKHTPYSIHSRVDIKGGKKKYRDSFHLTHSTNWLTR